MITAALDEPSKTAPEDRLHSTKKHSIPAISGILPKPSMAPISERKASRGPKQLLRWMTQPRAMSVIFQDLSMVILLSCRLFSTVTSILLFKLQKFRLLPWANTRSNKSSYLSNYLLIASRGWPPLVGHNSRTVTNIMILRGVTVCHLEP
ncbi:hypothetical protein Cob_v012872 [Colletotrichum orbiculare MAFF 240422]|uniref:Uncharacterized protein n=1 Tax=Colletotrichum orbiculare (strain 104-T / ATCC 96160 / CBS 514.97 / LARS 414 / MAFF 240422) TaxID=1213857 RepID=A0A484F7J1_COLOR|nr:hypothetical protein Cob_v012872 [Colletotrichum orbiculare MAFF 240422]